LIRVAVAVQAIAFFSKQCSTASAECPLRLFEYRIHATAESDWSWIRHARVQRAAGRAKKGGAPDRSAAL